MLRKIKSFFYNMGNSLIYIIDIYCECKDNKYLRNKMDIDKGDKI